MSVLIIRSTFYYSFFIKNKIQDKIFMFWIGRSKNDYSLCVSFDLLMNINEELEVFL